MKIRLVIEGLSVYNPEPFDAPETMHVLFPDVRKPVIRDSASGIINVCAHSPVISFPDGNSYSLNGEHIMFSDIAGDLEIDPVFFEKMSDMEKVAPGAGVLDRVYLKDPPPKSSSAGRGMGRVGLVADLHLQHGTFSVGAFTPMLAFRASRESAPIWTEELVSHVEIAIDVPGNRSFVVTQPFGGNKYTTQTVLQTKSPNDTVEVFIKNHCNRTADPSRPDEDFVIYYDLCADYRGPKYIPYPMPDDDQQSLKSGQTVPAGPRPSTSGSEGLVNAPATGIGSCIAGLMR